MNRARSSRARARARTADLIQLPSFAKINLGLEVLGVRQDGYHELRTLFQTIDLHDDIAIRREKSGGVTVSCDHPGVPAGEENLAMRAAKELLKHAGRADSLEIAITKRIPVAGGLGGGSSNAATVLLALDRLFKIGLGPAGLHPLARRLGADVPFFLLGGTALGLARGDEVYPLRRQVQGYVVLADPGVPLSTAAVFRRLDASLTPRENSNTIFRFVSRDLEGQRGFSVLANDLEQAALEEAPELRRAVGRIRGVLVREGARFVSLSGSGSTYFGLFDDSRRARAAAAALQADGWKALRCRTLGLDRYRRALQTAMRT